MIESIKVITSNGNKCPRCWTYHHAENHDFLCDKCCHVILADFPDHESAPKIMENMKYQRMKFCQRDAQEKCPHIRCCRSY